MRIQPGKIVTFDYSLRLENGDDVESTAGRSPFEFTCGKGNIIPGLEKGLIGLKMGDKKTIKVIPTEAYGESNPEAVRTIGKEQFPAGMRLEVGESYHTRDKQGQTVVFAISDIDGDTVTIDFNHHLAGKTLVFDITIVNVKDSITR
jgi:FKBP-type peptidyl-prolyl cis-trans isomerase 2